MKNMLEMVVNLPKNTFLLFDKSKTRIVIASSNKYSLKDVVNYLIEIGFLENVKEYNSNMVPIILAKAISEPLHYLVDTLIENGVDDLEQLKCYCNVLLDFSDKDTGISKAINKGQILCVVPESDVVQ